MEPKKVFVPLVELLGHKSIKIQKLSLFCIETYKDFITFKKLVQLTDSKTLYMAELTEIFEEHKSHIELDVLKAAGPGVIRRKSRLSTR